jgi:hypothetical protein
VYFIEERKEVIKVASTGTSPHGGGGWPRDHWKLFVGIVVGAPLIALGMHYFGLA